MRTHLFMALLLAGATATLAAQASPHTSSSKADKKDRNKPVTMSGCVTRDTAGVGQFTFTDSVDGTQYRLSGRNVDKYSGMSVQIVGIVDTRRLKIVGGLLPSPNIAAQAGAIDPGKAAVAALGGGTTGTGNVELPTLKVTRVGLGQGECRQ
jgi:hypothetical protein